MSTSQPHILILVQNLPVPFDRRVWMESNTLKEAGYRVSVISPYPETGTDEPIRTLHGIHIYRYPNPPQAKGKLAFFREYEYSLRHTRRLMKQVWKDCPFDVIQSCNPPDLFWTLARKYRRKHGVKYVFDHHDLCPELYESKFGRRDALYRALCWVERKQFEMADGVISTNQTYRDVAISRGRKHPDEVVVVRSGPKMAEFTEVRQDPAFKRGCKFLGVYLGVMGKQDGVDYALRAIRHALDGGLTNTTFAFIGSGDEHPHLLKLCKELKLDGHVHFTGRINDFELRTYFSTADFALAPDPKNPLNDVSTMNKIVEYMAFGLPIISFDLKESRFSAQEAAVYIPDNREDLMGQAIVELVNDPASRNAMAKFGRKRYQEHLRWGLSRDILVGFYERLLGQASATEPVASPTPDPVPKPAKAPTPTAVVPAFTKTHPARA